MIIDSYSEFLDFFFFPVTLQAVKKKFSDRKVWTNNLDPDQTAIPYASVGHITVW